MIELIRIDDEKTKKSDNASLSSLKWHLQIWTCLLLFVIRFKKEFYKEVLAYDESKEVIVVRL